MPPSAFRLDWIQLLLEHRTPPATALFQLFTFLGEIEGYVLVVALLYFTHDKKLAFRLAVLALGAMCLNHGLKTWIAHPRPFVGEGTWAEKWAVSASRAQELAGEYSTPSGHAMAGGTFYAYLAARVRRPLPRGVALAALLLTGLSRPYLGVHYVEDVILGWALGLAIAALAVRYGEGVARALGRFPLPMVCAGVVTCSAAAWLVTRSLYAASAAGPPLALLSYTGLLAGSALAYPLECRWVRFDPRSASAARKVVRTLLAVAGVLGTVELLDVAFGALAEDTSAPGHALRFLRHALAGVVGFLLAPFAFVFLGLAEAERAPRPRAAVVDPRGVRP